MSKNLKVFGVICGILASGLCFIGGIPLVFNSSPDHVLVNAIGFLIVALAFFTGPLLIILSLKSGHSASKVSKKLHIKKLKPAMKTKPAPGKTAAKAPAKSESKDDVTIIYVGNLSPEANETVLKTAFSGFGEIHKIKIIKDRGRPKGFGFVEMLGKEQALKAIEAMNGQELAGRPLIVNEAKTKPKVRSQRSKKPNNNIDNEPMRPNIFE